jgi:hypothetical protein
MRENFGRAVAFALEKEGYKTDDPKDPGKLTIWGISMVYHPIEVAKMVRMSKEEAFKYASEIYLKKYWIHFRCDNLPYPEDWIVFDIAINPGVKLVGLLRGDWRDYLFQRIGYYCDRVKERPYKLMFLRGWINRTLDLYRLVR